MRRIKGKLTVVGLILVLVFPLQATPQYYQKHGPLRVGLSTDAVFSTLYQHGFTFYLTAGNDCQSMKFGPRLSFNSIIGKCHRNPQRFVMDFDYRINYYTKAAGFNLYAFFHAEYGYQNSSREFFYQEEEDTSIPWMRLGDGDFNVRVNHKTHTTNFFIGLGAEFEYTDRLFSTVQAGTGIGLVNDYKTYTDLDKSQYINPRRGITSSENPEFLVSVGVGYRIAISRR